MAPESALNNHWAWARQEPEYLPPSQDSAPEVEVSEHMELEPAATPEAPQPDLLAWDPAKHEQRESG